MSPIVSRNPKEERDWKNKVIKAFIAQNPELEKPKEEYTELLLRAAKERFEYINNVDITASDYLGANVNPTPKSKFAGNAFLTTTKEEIDRLGLKENEWQQFKDGRYARLAKEDDYKNAKVVVFLGIDQTGAEYGMKAMDDLKPLLSQLKEQYGDNYMDKVLIWDYKSEVAQRSLLIKSSINKSDVVTEFAREIVNKLYMPRLTNEDGSFKSF